MAADSSAKYTGPTLVPTGQYAGQPGIQLRRPVYVIGSRSDARIHLKSSTVSRAHAILVQTRHETYIRDLASRGGIFVNGKQVREAVLKNGDLIGIGKFTFQYQANHISHGAEPPPHPAALQVSGGEFPIPIEGRVVLIGRRQGCDIQLTEEAASSSHAVILQWEGLRFIRDLGSRTGTFVNGQAIHELQLNPNDAIRIGETDITYSPSLEEAAFDLIGDASDSMIAEHPVAEEVNVAPHAEPVGTPAAPIVPHLPIAEIELDPFAHEALPLEEVAAKGETVEELSPLPLEVEPAEAAPEEAVEAVAEEDAAAPAVASSAVVSSAVVSSAVVSSAVVSSGPISLDDFVDANEPESHGGDHDADLVTLASDDAEPLLLELTPHDTAHIPLAVKPAEPPVETIAGIPEENAVVDAALQTSVGSIDMAGGAEQLSADQKHSSENLSEPIPLTEAPRTEIPIAETAAADAGLPTAVTDESVSVESATDELVTDESAAVESDGLELLDESGIPPFTPVSPEPLAEDVVEMVDDADLPRRGWRSGIVEPTAPLEIENESFAEPDARIEPPVAEANVSEPEIAQPKIAEPELTEAEAALLDEKQPQISELEADEPESVEPELTEPELAAAELAEPQPLEPQLTDDVLQFADEQTSTEEPTADRDAVIDLSALFSAEDFPESIEASSSVPVEEPIADLRVSNLRVSDLGVSDLGVSESAEPATAEPFDLSSVDFAEPSKTIADLVNEAPVIQAAPIETPAGRQIETPIETSIEPPVNTPDNVVAGDASEIPAVTAPVESAAPAVAEEPPLELIPDEFIPSGEVSTDDLPAGDSESLSSFKSRRQKVRDKSARSRRPRVEKIQRIANETIEPTEPTPQSALDLPIIESAISEIPAAEMVGEPPLPLVDLAADLSDTTFGRAVQEFEGESTGPIVEESAQEEHETAAAEANLAIPTSDESAPVEINHDLLEVSEPTAEIAPVEFAESAAETVAPNFRSENPDAPEIAEAEITDTEAVDVPAAHVPLFDANTIEDSIPSDLGHAPHPTVQRPLELPKSDFVGVDNTYVVPEEPSVNARGDALPPRVSNTLDLSKLEMEAESAPALEESVVSDVLSQPPTESGHATIDETADLAPPEVARSDEAPGEVPPGELPHDEMPHVEGPHVDLPEVEVPAAVMPTEPHPAEPQPADVEIDSADIDGLGANQTHYLGGEPLNLKEGVHPPEGFGEVSVDFSQPPMVHADAPAALKDEAAPPQQHQPSALPADHDILPPEAGDALVPSAPAALASLTTLASEVAAAGVAADPFLIDRAMSKVEIPAFGLAGTPPSQQQEPPAIGSDSDEPLRSIGKKRDRRARVIRNGFGQNPNAPKSEPTEASPFADSAVGLSGMAMDSIATPAIPDVDVFSELPPRGEKATKNEAVEKPRGLNEVGRDLTADAWTKSSPLPSRSRRRTTAIPFVPPTAISESVAAAGLTGIAPEYVQPRPVIVLEDENRANAAAERRSKLLKRVPIFCATMVALIGVAVTICVLFIPVRQQVQATMSYRNFDHLTHEEQLHFQADQERKLHLDGTRMLAITKLQNRHPQATPGFLNSPEQFAGLSLEWPESRAGEPGIAWINYQSSETNVDPARVQAVAMAMFEVNSDLSTAAQVVKQSMDKLNSDIAADGRQIEELTNKINAERAFLDGRPTLAELGRLKDDDATLEAAYKDAMDKAMTAQAAVDQLNKEHKAETAPTAPGTDPVAADAQIQQMSKDASALSSKIAAARKERADLAAKARATLDSAYDEFKKQVQDSQTVTKDNPQLAAYVTAAQNLQQAIHQLTDEYIQKQQDEYTQLNQMKSSLVTKIQQRQADLFANDPQMKQLNDQKEILTRKYNEAINSGLDKEASDLKNDLQLNDTATKAQKDLIANDQVYAELLNDMQQLLDQKQHNIDEQRKNTDQQLASMKEAFEKSAPTVEQLPAEQKQLAAAMQDKLAQIDAARKQYAEAADASAGDTDSSIQGMVNDLQGIQTNLETRKRQVAAANSEASRKAREDQFNADLSQKTVALAQLNKTAAAAQASYQANHAKLLQRESVADQTGASAQRLEQDINNQQALRAQLEQHKMAWDQKNNEFSGAVEPLEPEAQAHLVGAPIDDRVLYAGISSGSIVLLFLIAICWTVISAARESHHAYVPAFESLETPGHRKANGNGMQQEAEENEAAVA